MTQQEALSILKTGTSVFLTGEPGSGKSHTVNAYVRYLREHGIEPAITASTGIAATHIGGMTIHSWSGIGIRSHLDKYELDKITTTEYVVKRIARTHVLIIDEVSMLGPEVLSMIDAVCKEIKQNTLAFGGMQVILVGDFFQLPPISKATTYATTKDSDDRTAFTYEVEFEDTSQALFAYQSPAWKALVPIVCYLTEQHRQDDQQFLSLLQALRKGIIEDVHHEYIAGRMTNPNDAPTDSTRLFSHNTDVDALNSVALAKLTSKQKTYQMLHQGQEALVATLKKGCLSPEELILKVGASVMFTKNNPKEYFVNGTLGSVVDFDSTNGYPIVVLRSGRKITVEPMEWSVEQNGVIKARICQVPLRLAWAITVHKSQGMSLDSAVMDLSQVFEFGQGYVALSRVRRLKGLYLLGINEQALKVHPEIIKIDADFLEKSDEAVGVFSKIPHTEIQKMHDNFIRACGGTVQTVSGIKKIVGSKKTDTAEETLRLWKQGKKIQDIATTRNLTVQTILTHIEKLHERGDIAEGEIKQVLSQKIIKALPEIFKVFRTLTDSKLTPVHEALGGNYSFNDLRIVRMLYIGHKKT